jgi:hypothetical protein
MKNTFILYVFDIIRLYFFNNMFDQTLSSLTLTKSRMQGKNRHREYISSYFVKYIFYNLFSIINISKKQLSARCPNKM